MKKFYSDNYLEAAFEVFKRLIYNLEFEQKIESQKLIETEL
jgi:hypothetical protein